TPGALQTTCGDAQFPCQAYGYVTEGFVSKLSADGSVLIYSTYLGGQDGRSQINAIAVDASGSAYVTGVAGSASFPTTSGAFQTSCAISPGTVDACTDAFVSKLNPSGSGLVYSTFVGPGTSLVRAN